MVTIALSEPSADIRALISLAVRELGYEPLSLRLDARPEDLDVDVFLVEPYAGRGLALARRMRAVWPDLPIVVCSIFPGRKELRALDPVAFVLKPFRRCELETALATAVAAATARRERRERERRQHGIDDDDDDPNTPVSGLPVRQPG